MIIFRYLFKEVFTTLSGLMFLLLAILVTNPFIHYLHDAALGQFPISLVMQLMLLEVLSLLGHLLSIGLFLSLLIVLGRLMSTKEIPAMMACGMSRMQFVMMILIMSTAVAILVSALTLFLEPRIKSLNQRWLQTSKLDFDLNRIKPGHFQRVGHTTQVFYASGANTKNHVLTHIFFAKGGPLKKHSPSWDILLAQTASVQADSKKALSSPKTRTEQDLIFKQGMLYQGSPGKTPFTHLSFQSYQVNLNKMINNTSNILKNDHAHKIAALWRSATIDLNAAAELEWRFSIPLSVWIFALLSIPLSIQHSIKNRFSALIPAVLLFLIYAHFMYLSKTWVKNNMINWLSSLCYIHLIFFAIACIGLFFQSRCGRLFSQKIRMFYR